MFLILHRQKTVSEVVIYFSNIVFHLERMSYAFSLNDIKCIPFSGCMYIFQGEQSLCLFLCEIVFCAKAKVMFLKLKIKQ